MYTVIEKHDPAVAEAGRDLLTLGKPDTRPPLGTMARVRELLCQASEAPNAGNNFEGAGLPKLARKMMKTNVQELAGLRNKAAQFTDWNKEIQGIASTAKIQTEPFDDPQIARDLAMDGVDFRDLKKQPVTVYLILPPEMMARHSRWLRLLLTSAIQSVMRERKRGEPKILFMMDEFFALGHLEIISTVWALVRGYGIQMMPVLQDLNQLKKLYPDMWQTFIGMAGAVMSFAPNDLTTAEWLSRRMGERDRLNITFNSSTSYGGGSSSTSEIYNYSTIKAPLLSPHQLFGMPKSNVIVSLDGVSDVVGVEAPAYYEVEQTDKRARKNPYFHG